jgi:signal transduction histidine kinase
MSPTRRMGGWFDPVLAAVLLVAAEVEMVVRPRGGSFAVELGVVAAMTVPLAWRRRAPLPVAVVVMAMLVVLKAIDGHFHALSFPLFAVLIAPYSVGAGEPRARALVGLAVCLAGVFAIHAVGSDNGSFAFIVAIVTAAWAAGQVVRARRVAAATFKGKADRITAERADRERLAVIDERSRIARELHAVVATAVSAMVVQTDAAQRLLAVDAARADEAMGSLEDAGRRTLTEMRRVLGVLREENETAELAPQPGVGQIHTLIDNAQGDLLNIELKVQGEPGPLPASVNLGLYRILEDALRSTSTNDRHPTDVTLRFGELDVELTVTTTAGSSLSWPTPAMCERVALCDGAIDVEIAPSAATRLRVRLPSTFDGALL